MIHLFHSTSQQCSKITTEAYSTSFSSAIKLLHKDLRTPIYNIYGFVRFADEIVDTFHGYDKEQLLKESLEGNYILVFQHDEKVECCTVEMTPKGIRAKEKFGFSDII